MNTPSHIQIHKATGSTTMREREILQTECQTNGTTIRNPGDEGASLMILFLTIQIGMNVGPSMPKFFWNLCKHFVKPEKKNILPYMFGKCLTMCGEVVGSNHRKPTVYERTLDIATLVNIFSSNLLVNT